MRRRLIRIQAVLNPKINSLNTMLQLKIFWSLFKTGSSLIGESFSEHRIIKLKDCSMYVLFACVSRLLNQIVHKTDYLHVQRFQGLLPWTNLQI